MSRDSKKLRLSGNQDCLIAGSGHLDAVFDCEASKEGKRCLVIDKRPHTGGNTYGEKILGINLYKYDAHIFQSSENERNVIFGFCLAAYKYYDIHQLVCSAFKKARDHFTNNHELLNPSSYARIRS